MSPAYGFPHLLDVLAAGWFGGASYRPVYETSAAARSSRKAANSAVYLSDIRWLVQHVITSVPSPIQECKGADGDDSGHIKNALKRWWLQ